MRTAIYTIIILLVCILKAINPEIGGIKLFMITILGGLSLMNLIKDWFKNRLRGGI